MSAVAPRPSEHALALRRRDAFLRWQCRARQMLMRQHAGKPDDAIMPLLTRQGESWCRIVTVLCKLPPYSQTPEIAHIVRQDNDPAQRREKAMRLFSAAYYQKALQFSDRLTAVFPPSSPTAGAVCNRDDCRLIFDAYGQTFDFSCRITIAGSDDFLYQATWWHNALFNPNLRANATILIFTPDWNDCMTSPEIK